MSIAKLTRLGEFQFKTVGDRVAIFNRISVDLGDVRIGQTGEIIASWVTVAMCFLGQGTFIRLKW